MKGCQKGMSHLCWPVATYVRIFKCTISLEDYQKKRTDKTGNTRETFIRMVLQLHQIALLLEQEWMHLHLDVL